MNGEAYPFENHCIQLSLFLRPLLGLVRVSDDQRTPCAAWIGCYHATTNTKAGLAKLQSSAHDRLFGVQPDLCGDKP